MHGLCASQNGNHVDDRMSQKSAGNASSKVIWMVRGLKRDQSARCVDRFLFKMAVIWMIGWKPVRWRCGCNAQMTELACWCRSSMAVKCSPSRDGMGLSQMEYYAGLQALEIIRDLGFITQNYVETLRHQFSWCLWRPVVEVFESGYTM